MIATTKRAAKQRRVIPPEIMPPPTDEPRVVLIHFHVDDAFDMWFHLLPWQHAVEETDVAFADPRKYLFRLASDVDISPRAFLLGDVYPVSFDDHGLSISGPKIRDNSYTGCSSHPVRAGWEFPDKGSFITAEMWEQCKLALDGVSDTTLSAADIKDDPETALQWCWQDRIAQGHVTLLAADAKAGKSTVLRGLLEADGSKFLGADVHAKALVVTEEPKSQWLGHRDRDRLDFRNGAEPIASLKDWQKYIKTRARLARTYSCNLLGLDSLSSLVEFEENDPVAVTKVFAPLRQVAAEGLAVLLLHHLSKAGDVRGSTNIQAQCDRLLYLDSPDGALSATRDLISEGRGTRFAAEVRYELCADGTFASLNSGGSRRRPD